MTERFELTINSNGQLDIIDHIESKEKNAICIYNDLGVHPFSSAKAVCNLLNEQDNKIKQLKEDLDFIRIIILQLKYNLGEKTFKKGISNRYKYNEEQNEIYGTGDKYGQYTSIIDKRYATFLLNEYYTVIDNITDNKPFFKIVDDYTIKYDGDYFNLHKPSDIRSLIYIINRSNGYDELRCEYNGEEQL